MKSMTVMSGVCVRTWRTGNRSIRFSCMVRGQRFSHTLDVPVEAMVTVNSRGKMLPTQDLRAEYARWVADCEKSTGRETLMPSKSPTIGDVVRVYTDAAFKRARDPNYGRPCPRRINYMLNGLRRIMAELGMDDNSLWSDLADPQTLLRAFELRTLRGIKGITAFGEITGVAALTSKWMRPIYEALRLEVKRVEVPDVGQARIAPGYRRLPSETTNAIKAWYASLSGVDFVVASMMGQLAMRSNDVERLTWDNFDRNQSDGYVYLRYVPHKTEKSSNRRVNWPLSNALWQKICEVGGERFRNGGPLIQSSFTAIMVRLNRSLRRSVPAFASKDKSSKGMYELRKLCIDTIRRERGVDYAVAISGDRRETIDHYYSDPYELKGITPFDVMPLPEA